MVYLIFIPCDIPYFLVYTMVYYTFFIHVIQYGIPKLPAALAPTCRSCNVLGRAPLMPCYMRVNPHPTLPNSFGDRDGAKADTSRGRGNGSRLYELNLWMWHYGRGQPRKVTMAEAERRRKERTSEQRRKAVETMERRRAEREEPGRMEAESKDD
jgi:hypothetical protein